MAIIKILFTNPPLSFYKKIKKQLKELLDLSKSRTNNRGREFKIMTIMSSFENK